MEEVLYFEQVITYIRGFHTQISKEIPDEYLKKFLHGLHIKINDEIDSCTTVGENLQDSTILSLCLDTFSALCKNEKVYQLFPAEIDELLKILCRKLLQASEKDSEIQCLMLDMLTKHWYATLSFCECHKEALTGFLMKLGNNGDGNVQLDKEIFELIIAYCCGQKIWYDEFGQYVADEFRNKFISKMSKIGVYNVKKGADEKNNQKIVFGVMLLQSIVQNFSNHLQDEEIVTLIKSTNSMIGNNLKKKNPAFTASLMLIFNLIIANPKLSAKTLHESFNLRTLLELLQANILTLTKFSYERKVIFHALLELFKVVKDEDAQKLGIDRFQLFRFIAIFLHLHKLHEVYEVTLKPKLKRDIILHVVNNTGGGDVCDMINASYGAPNHFVEAMVEIIGDPNSRKKLSDFEKANVPTMNRLMSSLVKAQILLLEFEYDRPYEIDGLNEIALNVEEEEDNIYDHDDEDLSLDSYECENSHKEHDFDATHYEELLECFKTPIELIDEFLHYRKFLEEFKNEEKQTLIRFFENITGDDYSTFLELKGVKKVTLRNSKIIPRRVIKIKRQLEVS